MKSLDRSPDQEDLLRLLQKKVFRPSISLHDQIASHLRQLIEKQLLPVDTRLPSMRSLAELWGTNYNTVNNALTELAGEGLIVVRPVRGAFVAAPRRALRRACFYYHHEVDSAPAMDNFYSMLNHTLYRLLSQRRVRIVPFFDQRPFEKLHTVPPDLRKMANSGEIDAVIAAEIYPGNTSWLFNLEVPVASLMLERADRRIEVDVADIVSKVVQLALSNNRKTIGFIHRPLQILTKKRGSDFLFQELKRVALEHGIAVASPEYAPPPRGMHWEQEGAILCEKLLKLVPSPDMIFVYPDSFMRGVAGAIERHRIRVPQEILVVSHRNAETSIFIPFPMTWLTVKTQDFALKLLEQIDRQIVGDELAPSLIPVAIEEISPLPDEST